MRAVFCAGVGGVTAQRVNFSLGCCQTPPHWFQWKPNARSDFAIPGLREGDTSKQILLPTASACMYCWGHLDCRQFKTDSVRIAR